MLSMSLTVRDPSRSLELLVDGRRVGKFVVIFLTCQTTVQKDKNRWDLVLSTRMKKTDIDRDRG